MNLFKLFTEPLDRKWFSSLKKWIQKTGQNRVVLVFISLVLAALIYVYKNLFNTTADNEVVIDPNWIWKDELLLNGYYLFAIPMIVLNGIAWIISGLKFNLLFIIELILIVFFVHASHPSLFENIEIILLLFLIIGGAFFILPRQNKHNKHRSSRKSKHRSSRRRSSQHRSSRDSHEI
jgi:membrane protein YdbS with pleckstrin-like domain